MSVIICPGIHNSELTQGFVAGLRALGNGSNVNQPGILLFPAHDYIALSAFHILQFLLRQGVSQESPVVFISFSAGVIGALGAAWGWQLLGGKVKALIALDGWGVPLYGNFPIYRLSHDYFTHWSSAVLSNGEDSFYAEPPVEHLELWRTPQTIEGWWIHPSTGTQLQSVPPAAKKSRLTAAQFLTMLLERYREI